MLRFMMIAAAVLCCFLLRLSSAEDSTFVGPARIIVFDSRKARTIQNCYPEYHLWWTSTGRWCVEAIMAATTLASGDDGDDDDDFTSIEKKRGNLRSDYSSSIYVGNLPTDSTDEALQRTLAERLPGSSGICSFDKFVVVVQRRLADGAALVTVPNVDAALTALRGGGGLQLGGNKLVVLAREPRRRTNEAFGGGGWAKPLTQKPLPIVKPKSVHAEKNIMEVASNEERNGIVNRDPMAHAPLSTTFVAGGYDTAVLARNDDVDAKNEADFAALCRKPMASLLGGYGAHDPDWMNDVTTTAPSVALTASPAAVETTSRLERHGKAPIHVEFTSFGYRHGIPKGEPGHRLPLAPIDTRSVLPPVPPYMAWMDGLSGGVKNVMLRYKAPREDADQERGDRLVNRNDYHHGRYRTRSNRCPTTDDTAAKAASSRQNATVSTPEQADATTDSLSGPCVYSNVRDFARKAVAPLVADALVTAVAEGGHGYAAPLHMTIHIGSELGRHRSVVAAELAATALRKILRVNALDRFSCAVSVGSRHRDIKKNSGSNSSGAKKHNDPNDE